MGNNASSSGRGQHDETVDYGVLTPQGVYTGSRDWNHNIVSQLIIDRKLAPFYRPLEDYDDSWDDDQILAARKEFPPESDTASEESGARSDVSHASRPSHHGKRPSASLKEFNKQAEAAIYKGAIECPICFLYYPPNINHSRCCDQAICTECFVQIKRSEPTATHLVSEPASCPYCVRENFGVTYTPPPWRAGIGSENNPIPPAAPRTTSQQSMDSTSSHDTGRARRKSISADSDEVVTVDHIRPDWEAKLAAVRAAVARRANRRIIMRQVGDRLIPVGVTSGRVHPLTVEGAGEQGEGGEAATDGRGSRRSRRRQQQQQDLNQILGTIGLGGQDLEELMVMEAMRLSLLEHEEQQRREADKKKDGETGTAVANNGDSSSSNPTPGLSSNLASAPMNIAAGSAAARVLDAMAPSSGQTPSSLASSPGAHLTVSGTSMMNNRSLSPQPRRSGEELASASVNGDSGAHEGSVSDEPSTSQTTVSVPTTSSADVYVSTVTDNDTSDSFVSAPYIRLPSTAEMSLAEQPLLKNTPTSETIEGSSTEVN